MSDRIEQQLDTHFMRIVNMCRDGITDDEIRITAGFCQLPEWVIMRIAHDLRKLTPEQEVRYQTLLEHISAQET